LHHSLDLTFASDNWIEFSFAGSSGEVSAKLIEDKGR
jgi:hypothetical protein